MSITIAAVITVGSSLAAAGGVSTLGAVFVVAGGLLVVGFVLRLLGAARPMGNSVRSVSLLLLAAAAAAALTPVVYSAGMSYGASWLEWDPVHSTNFYAERPGGFIVLIAALVVCTALLLFAVAATLIVSMQTMLRVRRRRSEVL